MVKSLYVWRLAAGAAVALKGRRDARGIGVRMVRGGSGAWKRGKEERDEQESKEMHGGRRLRSLSSKLLYTLINRGAARVVDRSEVGTKLVINRGP